MGGFIDRNPRQMMRYGQDAKNVLAEMAAIIRGVESVLDSSAPDLDDLSQKQIQELHACCASYFKQMKVYEDVADRIYKEGKRLMDIQGGGL